MVEIVAFVADASFGRRGIVESCESGRGQGHHAQHPHTGFLVDMDARILKACQEDHEVESEDKFFLHGDFFLQLVEFSIESILLVAQVVEYHAVVVGMQKAVGVEGAPVLCAFGQTDEREGGDSHLLIGRNELKLTRFLIAHRSSMSGTQVTDGESLTVGLDDAVVPTYAGACDGEGLIAFAADDEFLNCCIVF